MSRLFSQLVRAVKACLPSPTYALVRAWYHRVRMGLPNGVYHLLNHGRARALAKQFSTAEVVIFLPGMDWHHPMFQRPHQLARALVREGVLVIFCTENRTHDRVRTLRQLEDHLYLAPGHFITRYFPDGALLCYSPKGRRYFGEAPRQRFLYDVLDDIALFGGEGDHVAASHRWLLDHATTVTVTASRLLATNTPYRRDLLLCPNGVDYPFFAHAQAAGPPGELRQLAPRKIIGYVGALARWFDYDLVCALAQAFPESTIVLIGMDIDGTLAQSRLSEYANIVSLGPRPYAQLPAYVQAFDVALIPFLVNAITLATSPVKMYEYLAAGCPVVATSLPECQGYPFVQTATSPDDFIDAVRTALTSPPARAAIREVARAHDWTVRARLMRAALFPPYDTGTCPEGARRD